ncbi:MAG: hypothetical protein ACYS9X_05065, partial [Planctomycetota bacterium]
MALRPDLRDSAGEELKHDLLDVGLSSVREVRAVRVYVLEGDIER